MWPNIEDGTLSSTPRTVPDLSFRRKRWIGEFRLKFSEGKISEGKISDLSLRKHWTGNFMAEFSDISELIQCNAHVYESVSVYLPYYDDRKV